MVIPWVSKSLNLCGLLALPFIASANSGRKPVFSLRIKDCKSRLWPFRWVVLSSLCLMTASCGTKPSAYCEEEGRPLSKNEFILQSVQYFYDIFEILKSRPDNLAKFHKNIMTNVSLNPLEVMRCMSRLPSLLLFVTLLGCSPEKEKSNMLKNVDQTAMENINDAVYLSCITANRRFKPIDIVPSTFSGKTTQIVNEKEGQYFLFKESFYADGLWEIIEFGTVRKIYTGNWKVVDGKILTFSAELGTFHRNIFEEAEGSLFMESIINMKLNRKCIPVPIYFKSIKDHNL
jgi:hypothetical protein